VALIVASEGAQRAGRRAVSSYSIGTRLIVAVTDRLNPVGRAITTCSGKARAKPWA
jgi:hypothetical protein